MEKETITIAVYGDNIDDDFKWNEWYEDTKKTIESLGYNYNYVGMKTQSLRTAAYTNKKSNAHYDSEKTLEELNYNNHGSTKYYFLAGYDVGMWAIPDYSYRDKNIEFDLLIGNVDTFGEYKNDFRNSFVNNSKYSELATNSLSKSIFDLKSSYGDNVVNNQSQLGIKFEGDSDNSKVTKRINYENAWMNIDTFIGHNVKYHFHGQNQKRYETTRRVISYLKQ